MLSLLFLTSAFDLMISVVAINGILAAYVIYAFKSQPKSAVVGMGYLGNEFFLFFCYFFEYSSHLLSYLHM